MPHKSMSNKVVRANLLSESPNVFNANRDPQVRINDVAKSMGVDGLTSSTKMKPIKRMK